MAQDLRRWFPVGELAATSDAVSAGYVSQDGAATNNAVRELAKSVAHAELDDDISALSARIDALNSARSRRFQYRHVHVDLAVKSSACRADPYTGIASMALKLGFNGKEITWSATTRKIGQIPSQYAPADSSFAQRCLIRHSSKWVDGVVEVKPGGEVTLDLQSNMTVSATTQVLINLSWPIPIASE